MSKPTNKGTFQWKAALNKSADNYHTIGCWVAVVLNPIWTISDYYVIPEHWYDFFVIRIVVSLASLLTLLGKKKFNLSTELVIGVPFLGISLQNAYMYSVITDPITLEKHTLAYIALFIGAGMLILWKPIYTIGVIAISLIGNILFFALNSNLHFDEILVNGGLLTFSVAIFTILLIQTRYSLTKREIIARLALAESNKKLEQQKKVIDEANQEITASINYARNIQNAILPEKEDIKSFFKDSFILGKPKDIVSGDFYWFAPINEDECIIAVADCTGHGVPGAFMSMIGNALLNKVVIENGVTKPSEILDNLRSGIIKLLKQGNSENEIGNQDGMDISLCLFNKSTMELQYAGANNPLYWIRNGELSQIKADKMPVGYSFYKGGEFKNHKLTLQKDDTFYLFTDGYADQFGGAKNKKYTYRRFREKLLNIQDAEMNAQKLHLNESFKKWKGNIAQIDDVCIIGVRIT